jgi:hypothetical protein
MTTKPLASFGTLMTNVTFDLSDDTGVGRLRKGGCGGGSGANENSGRGGRNVFDMFIGLNEALLGNKYGLL